MSRITRIISRRMWWGIRTRMSTRGRLRTWGWSYRRICLRKWWMLWRRRNASWWNGWYEVWSCRSSRGVTTNDPRITKRISQTRRRRLIKLTTTIWTWLGTWLGRARLINGGTRTNIWRRRNRWARRNGESLRRERRCNCWGRTLWRWTRTWRR